MTCSKKSQRHQTLSADYSTKSGYILCFVSGHDGLFFSWCLTNSHVWVYTCSLPNFWHKLSIQATIPQGDLHAARWTWLRWCTPARCWPLRRRWSCPCRRRASDRSAVASLCLATASFSMAGPPPRRPSPPSSPLCSHSTSLTLPNPGSQTPLSLHHDPGLRTPRSERWAPRPPLWRWWGWGWTGRSPAPAACAPWCGALWFEAGPPLTRPTGQRGHGHSSWRLGCCRLVPFSWKCHFNNGETSSRFKLRNWFWFKTTFIYAQVWLQLGWVRSKDPSSQSVKPPVMSCWNSSSYISEHLNSDLAAAAAAAAGLLWTSFSSDSRRKINTMAHLTFQATKLTNQRGWDARVRFGFAAGRKKSMQHGLISSVEEAEREEEGKKEEEEEEVCCWGCGYTVSVPSINLHRKSAGWAKTLNRHR